MPSFDRFDIVHAHAVFSHEHHTGQTSELYRRLSRCTRLMSGGFDYRRSSLSDNGVEIYRELCERFGRRFDFTYGED